MSTPRRDQRAGVPDSVRLQLLENDMDQIEAESREDREWIKQEFKATRALVLTMMSAIMVGCIGTIITLVVTR